MKKIIPSKITINDEARVIAPSRSLAIVSEDIIYEAKNRLESYGLRVSFGESVFKIDNKDYQCASIEDRVNELSSAFQDSNIKIILTSIGGYNVNQILDYLDYDMIERNSKIICGFSDITALLNAIYAKTGLVTYYGPHFSSFGMVKGIEYTEEYFKKIFFDNRDIIITSSNEWSNDLWFLDQNKRNFIVNDGMKIISKGVGEGVIIGGNLCTLNLLQGTEYMPRGEKYILFIEDDCLITDDYFREFDRNLQSLIHCIGAKNINGIVVGRAEIGSKMNYEKWKNIFKTKKELKNIPIIIDADFGHTTPIFTFPIGGKAILEVTDEIKLVISNI